MILINSVKLLFSESFAKMYYTPVIIQCNKYLHGLDNSLQLKKGCE